MVSGAKERADGILMAGLVPHPPIIVPEVGGAGAEQAGRTCRAMDEWARRVKEAAPDAIVIISPHGPVHTDEVAVTCYSPLQGNLGAFGAPQVRFSWPCDLELAKAVARRAGAAGLPAILLEDIRGGRYRADAQLDHGTMVPLYYLRRAGVSVPLVPVAMAFLPYADLYRFGAAVALAARDCERQVAVFASGDLSHRLEPGAPAGYDPQGRVFDATIVEALGKADVSTVLSLDPRLAERAGECGLRPLIMALGSVGERDIRGEVLSYEGPFGVGYAVALLEPRYRDVPPPAGGDVTEVPARAGDASVTGPHGDGKDAERAEEAPAVRLARAALETYVREGRILEAPPDVDPELRGRAGVFVSVKRGTELRGCIGTTGPTCASIAGEIIQNAINAGTGDPRFLPVSAEELAELTYSVDVLGPLEPVRGLDELDPRVYGVVVRKGRRSGLLLPDLAGVDTAAEQVAIACRKAGIAPEDPGVRLYRFRVTRHR